MYYSITEAVLWLTVPSVTYKCVSYNIYFSVLEFLFFTCYWVLSHIFFFSQNSEICLEFSNFLVSSSPSLFLQGRTILFSRIFVIVINRMNRDMWLIAAAGSMGGTGIQKTVFLVSLSQTVYGNKELNELVILQDVWADLSVICLVLEKHSITIRIGTGNLAECNTNLWQDLEWIFQFRCQNIATSGWNCS